MRIKLKYPDVETFIQKYAVNISRGGIFIATKQPKPVGTFVKFEFLLSDATTTSIIRGEGQVQWTKEYDAGAPDEGARDGREVFAARRRLAGGRSIARCAGAPSTAPIPGAPIPIPTSSAHTIATRNESQADRLPERDRRRRRDAPSASRRSRPSRRRRRRRRRRRSSRRCARVETNEPLPPMPPGRGETRPIAIDHIDDEHGRPPNVETRPIPLSMRAASRTRPGDEIDALVSEWGLSEEKLAKILKRSRGRVGLEATAELERLLLKPPKLPTPTKAEALQQLAALLSKKNGKNGTH